jgi:hypothetical protein
MDGLIRSVLLYYFSGRVGIIKCHVMFELLCLSQQHPVQESTMMLNSITVVKANQLFIENFMLTLYWL